MTTLTADKVNSIFSDCLFHDGEDTSKHIRAEGVINTVGFHPERLESHKHEIIDLLNELPDGFHGDKGGGWSFLNSCKDKHGNQWADLHQTMEKLFLLGMGIDRVRCVMPRELWSVLPGGMPYYVITKGEIEGDDKEK